MLVLIDESGDPGFKLTKGSTPHFVLAMVIFRSNSDAESTSSKIRGAQKSLGIKPEFKFNKCACVVRDAFFEVVKDCDFGVRALVVDKSLVYSGTLRDETDRFYNYFVRLLMHHDSGSLTGARVKIDGSGSRQFKQELNAYLRKQLGAGKVKSIKFADSHKDHLVQLADMCAGAIARSYRPHDRGDHNRWRKMLKPRIEDIWNFR